MRWSSAVVTSSFLVATLAVAAPTGATTLLSEGLSGDAAGGVNLYRSEGSAKDMSPDGRFVVFKSTASDLVAGISDTNGAEDVFLRDTETGTTAILTVDADGNALGNTGNNLLGAISFSPDSTRMVFRTGATNVVAGLADTNNAPDWFVRELLAGTTSCVSINSAGTSTGNSTSFTADPPVFSPDSKLLAFISIAGDLVDGVTDTAGRDLFLRDLEAETTALISITTDGGPSGLAVDELPKFSPDGRYLAFLDMSPELVAGVTDTNNFTDLFVRDLDTDTTLLVTRNADDTAALLAGAYEWSADGSTILFPSPSDKLVAGVTDTNSLTDAFIWELGTQTVSIVSVSSDGTAAGDKPSTAYGISPDSRYVAFESASTNLTAESASGDLLRDLYVRDLETNTTAYVSRNVSSSVAFVAPRFSPDGVHMLYRSLDPDDLGSLTDANDEEDLILYNLGTGEKTCVTVNFEGTATSNTVSTSADDVVLSPNGRYVSFVSDATDLVEDFTTQSTRELFVRDVVAGETALVTAGLQGQGAGYDQGATRDAEFSTDSRFLVFTDNALLASQVTTSFNFNFAHNLYAFDLVSHDQSMLSVNAAANAPANGGVEPFSFIVNPAGETVFFLSVATDMVAGAGDTPFTYDLFETPLPAGAAPGECADPVPDPSITVGPAPGASIIRASDSLFILRVAVGSKACGLCVCDVDGSGSISAVDALVTLKIAVGQSIALQCPACE